MLENREGEASRSAGSTNDAPQSSPSGSKADNDAVVFLHRWAVVHRLAAIHPTKKFMGKDGKQHGSKHWRASTLSDLQRPLNG